MLKFGSSDPPKLTKNTLESVAVDTFIKYLHQLIRADAFDDSVIINLIDSETIGLLTYYFQPTETAREHPITHHWTVDWDVATIIQALEELYPLQQEHRHLDRSSCRAIVVVLTLTVLIVNAWYPHARPPPTSQR
jgi:hypothetical protein